MSRYGAAVRYIANNINQKIVELLYHQEDLSKPMAEFVGECVKNQGEKISTEIISDLTNQIYHSDSSHESIGIKNIAKFMSKLSKQVPKTVYHNISNLMGFFDCDNYMLRISLIKIL